MNKLKLDVDAPEATSFDTDAADGGRGTVMGAGVLQPVSPKPADCFQTEITGSCCEYAFALSCRLTHCDGCI